MNGDDDDDGGDNCRLIRSRCQGQVNTFGCHSDDDNNCRLISFRCQGQVNAHNVVLMLMMVMVLAIVN